LPSRVSGGSTKNGKKVQNNGGREEEPLWGCFFTRKSVRYKKVDEGGERGGKEERG